MSEDNRVNKENRIFHGELSGSMYGLHAGTYMSELHNHQSEHKKQQEKKRFEELMKMTLETPRDVADLLEGLKQVANEIETSIKKTKSYKDAYDSQDIATLTLILENDGINVNGLTDREKLEAAHEQILANLDKVGKDIEIFKEGNNKILDSDVAEPEQIQEAQKNLEKAAEWEKEIKDLQSQYDRENTNDFISKKDSELWNNENLSSPNLILEGINRVQPDPFANIKVDGGSKAENQSISHASSISDDPFAEVAQSISDPFNKVAQGLNIKEKTLENEVPSREPIQPTTSLQPG